jgi:hypothetical protein
MLSPQAKNLNSLCRAVPDVDALGGPTDAAEHSIRLEVIKLRASTDAPPAVLPSRARRVFALASWSEHWAYPFVPEEMHRVM